MYNVIYPLNKFIIEMITMMNTHTLLKNQTTDIFFSRVIPFLILCILLIILFLIIKKFPLLKQSCDSKKKNHILSKRSILEDIFDIVLLSIPFVLTYFIFTQIILVSVVQTGSMEPTLMVGNTVFYNQYAYAKKAFEEKRYTQASTLLTDLVTFQIKKIQTIIKGIFTINKSIQTPKSQLIKPDYIQ